MTRWCSIVTLLILAGSATAFAAPPPVFVMANPPVPGQYPALDPANRLTMIANIQADGYGWGQTTPLTGYQSAQYVASEIIRRRNTNDPPLPDGKICIWLANFGADTEHCDEGKRFFNDAQRYFTEEDRIPGLSDFAGFPQIRTSNNLDFRTARTYRHPFLKNATAAGPLRAWMVEFVETYWMTQMGNNSDTDPTNDLPDPDRFYFDNETYISWPGGDGGPSRNQVYMLQQIAQRPEYWNDKDLPGFPGNTRLANLYAQAAAA